MNLSELKKKLLSYIKFKDLAKSIKLVALSQLSNLKSNISTRGIPLSNVMPFYNKKFYISVLSIISNKTFNIFNFFTNEFCVLNKNIKI